MCSKEEKRELAGDRANENHPVRACAVGLLRLPYKFCDPGSCGGRLRQWLPARPAIHRLAQVFGTFSHKKKRDNRRQNRNPCHNRQIGRASCRERLETSGGSAKVLDKTTW